MTLVLTIVRHGNTFGAGEAPRRIGARTDLPLVAHGEQQARALGEAFAADGTVFTRALVSPLLRTRQTAALILARLSAPPVPEPQDWLGEVDHGPDEDRPEREVVARIGAAALAAWDRALVAPPGWTVAAPHRLAAWRILMRAGTGHVLLVTSNGAARFALHADAALAAQAGALASTKLRTGAWGRIVVSPSGPRLSAWDVRP